MSVVEEIAWGDGSGDKIYLTSNAFEGDQTVLVSSDANTGIARTKTVTFTAGTVTQTLTVTQARGIEPVFSAYLYFDGTAYIDTDIPFVENSTFRVTGGLEELLSTQRLFMFGSTSAGVGSIEGSSTNSTNRVFNAYYCSGALTSQTISQQSLTFTFFLTPKRIGIASTSTTFTKGSTAPEGNLVIGSNGIHNGQAYTGMFGRFRIYGSDAQNVTSASELDNYTPIHDLRPCLYGGEYGLWDVPFEKFYGNSAGGGGVIAVSAFNANLSSYDSSDKSYYSIDYPDRAYNGSTNSTYATINLTRGSGATTYVYYKFNTSSLPANANIVAVYCIAKASSPTTNTSQVASAQVRLYSGTTAKCSAQNLTSSAAPYRFVDKTMTRQEVNDIRVRIYAKRGTSNVNTGYSVRLYGATLYVLYTT